MMYTFAVSQDDIYEMKFHSQINMLYAYWGLGLASTEHALNTENVKNFIKNDKSKFDVIFAEQFFQESMLMFAHKYNAPIVTLCKMDNYFVLDDLLFKVQYF